MPLQEIEGDGEAYLVEDDIVIDSQFDIQSGTNTDFVFTPTKVLNNVTGIEIGSIQVDQSLSGPLSINSWFDIQFTTDEVQPRVFIVSFQLPAMVNGSTQQELAELLQTSLTSALLSYFADGYWLTARADFFGDDPIFVSITVEAPVDIPPFPPAPTAPVTVGFANDVRFSSIILLFGSGEHADKTAAEVYGFEKTDFTMNSFIIGDPGFPEFAIYYYEAQAQNLPRIPDYSYIDLFIDELPELQPFFRFFPPRDDSVVTQVLPARRSQFRLLTQPIRRLERLTIHVRLRGGFIPTDVLPLYLTLRIYHIKQGYNIPDYMTERIILK